MDAGSQMLFPANTGAKLITGSFRVKTGAEITADFIRVQTGSLHIEPGSVITSSGVDRSSSTSRKFYDEEDLLEGEGGGHGSVGGSRYSPRGGIAHGRIENPEEFGTSGGNHRPYPLVQNVPTGGLGGGFISLQIGSEFVLDGKLNVNGAPGANSYGGSGGAGGSVNIRARIMNGYGEVTANGGQGTKKYNSNLQFGGGSGGRVAFNISTSYRYKGKVNAVGGKGYVTSTSRYLHGGPGSVFVYRIRNQLPYRSLYVDGANLDVFKYITLLPNNQSEIIFDLVTLVRQGSLRMKLESNNENETNTLHILRIRGDKSGLVRAYQSHKLIIEVDKNGLMVQDGQVSSNSSTPTFARPYVNFIVETGGELILPTRIVTSGSGVPLNSDPEDTESTFAHDEFASVSFLLDGRLTNVNDFHVGIDGYVAIGAQAHSALLEKGVYVEIGKAGEFRFGVLDLYTGSVVRFLPDLGMVGGVCLLQQYNSKLSAEHFSTSSWDALKSMQGL
ncbi:uncharacterized protein LOC144746988 [Ciona intestinalis]